MILAALLLPVANAWSQTLSWDPDFRPPAIPLVAHDPYFSIWSMANQVTEVPKKHWSGVNQALYGILRVDGKNYRFLGALPRHRDAEPAMKQVSVSVTPTRTTFVLTNPEIELDMAFMNLLFPDDLALLSRPVTYLTWKIKSRGNRDHKVTLYLDAAGTLAVWAAWVARATNNRGDIQ